MECLNCRKGPIEGDFCSPECEAKVKVRLVIRARTTVIHVKDAPAGWKQNPRFVYCGRGSKWGNPFPITANQDRNMVCDMHQRWFEDGSLAAEFFGETTLAYKRLHPPLVTELRELVGKVLVCFCHPQRCHCHYLSMRAASLDAQCVVCHKNWVDVANGYDTCQDCLKKA